MSIIETKRDDPHCRCGGKLVPHTSAGRGRYKDLPKLLCCDRCWTSWNPLSEPIVAGDPLPEDMMRLQYTKSRRSR